MRFLPVFRSRISSSPSRAPPRVPLTKIRSPSLAPERVIARPRSTSPITVILMATRGNFEVSPPARVIPNWRAARAIPERNRLIHAEVRSADSAKLRRKYRGAAPIAARSLVALASALYPTASGGWTSARKWTPSKNWSQLTNHSIPLVGRITAASSPIPRRRPRRAPDPFPARSVRAICSISNRSVFIWPAHNPRCSNEL